MAKKITIKGQGSFNTADLRPKSDPFMRETLVDRGPNTCAGCKREATASDPLEWFEGWRICSDCIGLRRTLR